MFGLSKLPDRHQSIATDTAWPIHVQRVFLGFVTFCLVAPLVQTIYPVFGNSLVSPVEERRSASPFPSLQLLAGMNGDFAVGLNKWFDDRVGFRDLLIRSKNQIDYTMFHTSKKVRIGAEGWLFYLDPPPDMNGLDAAGMSALEASYVALAHRLQDKGIKLIVVGYPTKAAIYPERAPPDLPLRPAGGNYDQFRNFLATRSELTFIDAEEIIKRLKSTSSELLYAKGDIHATQFAQRPVVKEIVAQIAQAEGRPDIRWNEKLTLTHQQLRKGGIERNLLAVLFPPEEDVPIFEGGYPIGGQETDGDWTIPNPHFVDRADPGIGRPFDFEFRSLPQLCPQRLPGMVLFGNSFSDFYWMFGLHRYFCFIRRARNPISRFMAFYDTMPPDTKYFIFQYYEPWLLSDMPPLE
jgi:alginate O-acetyltransferase complex protein AlgJ